MRFIIKLILTAALVLLLSNLLSGVTVTDYTNAIFVAIALSLLNSIVRPILVVLTFPITLVTMGLFLLVINVLIIFIADHFIDGFTVTNFWWALLFSILLAIGRSILSKLLDKND